MSTNTMTTTQKVEVTDELVRFARSTAFETLPDTIVEVSKRNVIDALACAFAGTRSDRGEISTRVATRLGGPAEASVIGTGAKIACVNAAFANSELMNALDYDATPHSPPNIVPPLLAAAEMRGASGRELITSLAVAHETAWRLYSAMSSFMSSYVEKGTSPTVFGNSNEAVLGAAFGAGRMFGLDPARLANAVGLTAYFCSLPVGKDWHTTPPPKPMVKYAPTGWLSKAALTAVLLAEEGMTGHGAVLDSEYGFWRFYGAARWDPDSVLDGLGERWVSGAYHFKPYPCCRFFHSQIDCFLSLLRESELQPEEIESVESLSMPFAANPDQMSVSTQSDAQFSLPYNLAVAAYGIPVGPQWQALETRQDPRIRAFMKKVSFGVHPQAQRTKAEDPRSWLASVTLKARGRTYTSEVRYARGTPVPGYALSEQEMTAKFVDSAQLCIGREQALRAVERLWQLEKIDNVAEIMGEIAP